MNKEIEIPFGAKDSELKGWEYTIPDNMEAEIKDGKIIVKQKESEDEWIRKHIIKILDNLTPCHWDGNEKARCIAYLERQKDKDKCPEFCVRSDCTGCSIYEKQKKQKPIYNLEIPAGDVAPAEEDSPFDEDEFLDNELSAFLQNYDKEYDDDAAVSDVARHFYEIGKKQKKRQTAEDGFTNNEPEYDKGYREGHRFGLKQTEEYMLSGGKMFKGLIPCWINAPSELQPAHKYHGKNVVVMHENNGGFRCTCIDDEKATTFHLPEDTLFVEGWIKRPAEWSEKDKECRKELIQYIEKRIGDGTTGQSLWKKWHSWLCSLPERFILQPKQEWSEEEEKMIGNIILVLIGSPIEFEEEIQFLKSLRPQQKYEWSEADEKDLIQLIENGVTKAICKKGFKFHFEDEYVKELVEYIKAFNPQPHWKPSEEQMKALGIAIRCGIQLGTWEEDALRSLLNDLEKI